MAVNRFEQNINSKRKLASAQSINDQKIKEYLLGVSTNKTGSPLRVLLNPEERSMCREFMDLMARSGYSGAERLKLEIKASGTRPLNISELRLGSWRYSAKSRLISGLRWKRIWSGKGYPIGVLSEKSAIFISDYDSCKVYLCSDLKLRCTRSNPIFGAEQSYAHGVGDLPLMTLPSYKFKIGRFVDAYDDSFSQVFEEANLEAELGRLSEILLLN